MNRRLSSTESERSEELFESSDFVPTENSQDEEHNNDADKRPEFLPLSNGEFKPLSNEQEDALFAHEPKVLKSLCEKSGGVLYLERYESFVYKNWPYDVKRGHLCHPRALALAGLAFYSLEPSPSAQCQVCLQVFENLTPNSNPWILHSEARPDCYIVGLGQRGEPDDYTIDELTQMAFQKILKEAELNLKEKESILKQQLYTLKQLEKSQK